MLDPRGRAEIISTVLRLNREKGITVVLITHFMEEAENADRAVVMDDGKIIADATPREIFSNYEMLRGAGLDLPQTTELLYKLGQNGIGVSTDVISIEDTAEVIYKAVVGGK